MWWKRKESRTSVSSQLTDLWQTTQDRSETFAQADGKQTQRGFIHRRVHEAWMHNPSQTSSFVSFSFSQRCLIAQQAGREYEIDTQTNNMLTKKPKAYLTPNAQPKGHEHAGSLGLKAQVYSLTWRQIVAGETWLGKGAFPECLETENSHSSGTTDYAHTRLP